MRHTRDASTLPNGDRPTSSRRQSTYLEKILGPKTMKSLGRFYKNQLVMTLDAIISRSRNTMTWKICSRLFWLDLITTLTLLARSLLLRRFFFNNQKNRDTKTSFENKNHPLKRVSNKRERNKKTKMLALFFVIQRARGDYDDVNLKSSIQAVALLPSLLATLCVRRRRSAQNPKPTFR